MRTYRELFATKEFAPLFATSTLHVVASTIGNLALGTLVFEATGSPLLSALAMFGPLLAQVVGATLLMSAADRLPPRMALAGLAVVFGVGTAVQAIPDLPIVVRFAVLVVIGVVASVGGGVRYGLLNEILTRDGFLLGRSVLNMAVGGSQIAGFAAGGLLVALFTPVQTLLVSAALEFVAALVVLLGLSRRPPRTSGRPSVAQTWQGNSRLWASRPRRYVFLALWVPNGLIVGCESLFVSYDPASAGVLFAFAAFGMLIGDTLVGRFLPAGWRERLGGPMRLLLAVPYLVFFTDPPIGVAVAAVTLASVGYAASLLLQERLMALTPDELSGHALGLNGSGMMVMQGVGAAVAGSVAQVSGPATAMTVMAVASVAVTLALAPGLRPGPAEVSA
ncbi:MFS transporter [Herbidospora sp. NBRC 101105]|uniref:MFS transporter n=1 Tax=Herbidospora sp. NBRC 101105 TaxID=3032195 RepID=UPI0024A51794|nr:MFS transporter [Herbidospora sp. NBRC 101105]GLX96335.1 membrane protein [Herbidospora sp. NBRC 101105]